MSCARGFNTVIDCLRRKFVNKFFFRKTGYKAYSAAYVIAIIYEKNDYVIKCITIDVDDEFEEIKIVKNVTIDMSVFIVTFKERGKKWAEGFMESTLEQIKEFGKGQIDV